MRLSGFSTRSSRPREVPGSPGPGARAPAAPSSRPPPAGPPLRRLGRYLARERWSYLAGVACLLLTSGLALLIPWVVKGAVEALSRTDPAGPGVGADAALIATLALLQAGTRSLSRLLLLGAAQRVEASIRGDLYARLVILPPRYYLGQRIGDLMSRATNDLQAVVTLVGFGLLSVVSTFATYAGVLVAMLAIDPTLTLVALLPYPLVVGVLRRFTTRLHADSLAAQEQLANLSARLQENLTGMTVVRAYTMERREVEAFRRLNTEHLRRVLTLASTQGAFSPLMGIVGGAGTLAVLWLGGSRVVEGRLTLGGLIAFASYLAYLSWPTQALGWVLALSRRGLTAMGRITEILDASPAVPEGEGRGVSAPGPVIGLSTASTEPGQVPLAVEVRGLTFSYQEERPPALQDVSLSVPVGATVAIVGPTGSGKTTLLQCLARLWEPPPGTVLILGRDVHAWPLDDLRARLGYVPQEPFLFSRPLADNVLLGASTDRLPTLARLSGLAEDLPRLPEGWDTVVGERGLALSGGQRQRASLARALARDPGILVLDDAFSSIDAIREQQILDQLLANRTGRTTVVATHRLAAAERADHVIVLEEGRVAEEGTHAELMARRGLYARLWRRQRLQLAVGEAP